MLLLNCTNMIKVPVGPTLQTAVKCIENEHSEENVTILKKVDCHGRLKYKAFHFNFVSKDMPDLENMYFDGDV